MGFRSAAKDLMSRLGIRWRFGPVPKQVLVLLTNPRSGSTWFSDAIRCHPRIDYRPSADLCLRLGLRVFRRYPLDLSDGPDGSLSIETMPGLFAAIPRFDVSDVLGQEAGCLEGLKPYAIEKMHPENLKYDAVAFNRNVNRLEQKGVEFKFIYQVRDPEASMVSFMNYQERNPDWYPSTKGEELARYMLRTYRCLIEMARLRDGLIVDYSSIASDMTSALSEVYAFLWPGLGRQGVELAASVSRAAAGATSRKKRAESGSPFLGREAGHVSGTGDSHAEFFERFREETEHCGMDYRAILEIRGHRGLASG